MFFFEWQHVIGWLNLQKSPFKRRSIRWGEGGGVVMQATMKPTRYQCRMDHIGLLITICLCFPIENSKISIAIDTGSFSIVDSEHGVKHVSPLLCVFPASDSLLIFSMPRLVVTEPAATTPRGELEFYALSRVWCGVSTCHC